MKMLENLLRLDVDLPLRKLAAFVEGSLLVQYQGWRDHSICWCKRRRLFGIFVIFFILNRVCMQVLLTWGVSNTSICLHIPSHLGWVYLVNGKPTNRVGSLALPRLLCHRGVTNSSSITFVTLNRRLKISIYHAIRRRMFINRQIVFIKLVFCVVQFMSLWYFCIFNRLWRENYRWTIFIWWRNHIASVLPYSFCHRYYKQMIVFPLGILNCGIFAKSFEQLLLIVLSPLTCSISTGTCAFSLRTSLALCTLGTRSSSGLQSARLAHDHEGLPLRRCVPCHWCGNNFTSSCLDCPTRS